jgi:hypothetical protein
MVEDREEEVETRDERNNPNHLLNWILRPIIRPEITEWHMKQINEDNV